MNLLRYMEWCCIELLERFKHGHLTFWSLTEITKNQSNLNEILSESHSTFTFSLPGWCSRKWGENSNFWSGIELGRTWMCMDWLITVMSRHITLNQTFNSDWNNLLYKQRSWGFSLEEFWRKSTKTNFTFKRNWVNPKFKAEMICGYKPLTPVVWSGRVLFDVGACVSTSLRFFWFLLHRTAGVLKPPCWQEIDIL